MPIKIKVQLNGKALECDSGQRLGEFLESAQISYDLLIVNGFIETPHKYLASGDVIYAIWKGHCPSEELYTSVTSARHSPGVQQVLGKATVAICGVGGLGSNIAVHLCRSGIGRLMIFDFDIVDPTNLNRQQYYFRHIGMKKVTALKEILADINPYIPVEAHDVYLEESSMKALLASADIIVEAFDRAENKSLLVNVVRQYFPDKPIFTGSGMAGYGKSNDIQTKRLGSKIYVSGDLISEAKPFSGLMAPRVAIVSGHQSNAVVRYLLGESEV